MVRPRYRSALAGSQGFGPQGFGSQGWPTRAVAPLLGTPPLRGATQVCRFGGCS